MFFLNKKINPEFIIAGLGNPGNKYINTRHNVGFCCVDYILKFMNEKMENSKFDSLFGSFKIENKKVLMLKPQTFMNLSGDALEKAMRFYKIPPEKTIVILDDVNFDVGKIRVREKGSHGGHNGMRSIIETLDSEDFKRIKIGVGKKPNYFELSDWVLSGFSQEEKEKLKNVFSQCFLEIKNFLNKPCN